MLRPPRLNAPAAVAVDSSGDVFIADTTNDRVRMVPASSGTFFGQAMTRADIYTVAGTGTACSTHTPAGCGYTSGGVPQLATTALLDLPGGVAADSSGNLYIADTSDNMVAMVATTSCSSACPFGLTSTTAGDIYTIAGTGTACATHTPAGCGYTSGGVAQAATSANLDAPSGAALDSLGEPLHRGQDRQHGGHGGGRQLRLIVRSGIALDHTGRHLHRCRYGDCGLLG